LKVPTVSPSDLPDDVHEVRRTRAGQLYVDAEVLPDLSVVREHARRLDALVITGTTAQPRFLGRAGVEWTLEFSYRDQPFLIYTNYHEGLSRYGAVGPGCPEPLLREVVAHFESLQPPYGKWVPPPPLGGRRLLLLLLFALAVTVPLTVFLVLFRRP
jgi:hypothetical protein